MDETSSYLSGRPSPEQSRAKQDAVLRSARNIFRAKGFDAATVDEIAAAARVSKRTLYKWHPDKASLFAAAFAEFPVDAPRLLLRPKRRVGSPRPPTDMSGATFPPRVALANSAARRLPSLAQLSSLDSLYRLGGFRAAAAEQNITVAALSSRIRALEADLGQTLLERSSEDKRKTKFTAEGMAMAAFVQEWLGSLYDHLGWRTRLVARRDRR